MRLVAIAACIVGLGLVHLGDLSRVTGSPIASYGLVTDGHVVSSVIAGSAAASMEEELVRLRAALATKPV
ncbi:MAG: hypothetical protein ACREMP_01355 [Candidatus Tyrphobacter sp.]